MLRRFVFWLRHNASSSPARLAAKYLRRKGWVAFYLEPQHRVGCGPLCWLTLYEHEMQKDAK